MNRSTFMTGSHDMKSQGRRQNGGTGLGTIKLVCIVVVSSWGNHQVRDFKINSRPTKRFFSLANSLLIFWRDSHLFRLVVSLWRKPLTLSVSFGKNVRHDRKPGEISLFDREAVIKDINRSCSDFELSSSESPESWPQPDFTLWCQVGFSKPCLKGGAWTNMSPPSIPLLNCVLSDLSWTLWLESWMLSCQLQLSNLEDHSESQIYFFQETPSFLSFSAEAGDSDFMDNLNQKHSQEACPVGSCRDNAIGQRGCAQSAN